MEESQCNVVTIITQIDIGSTASIVIGLCLLIAIVYHWESEFMDSKKWVYLFIALSIILTGIWQHALFEQCAGEVLTNIVGLALLGSLIALIYSFYLADMN